MNAHTPPGTLAQATNRRKRQFRIVNLLRDPRVRLADSREEASSQVRLWVAQTRTRSEPDDSSDRQIARVRRMIFEAEVAHESLDRLGVPRFGDGSVEYTIAQRIAQLAVRAQLTVRHSRAGRSGTTTI